MMRPSLINALAEPHRQLYFTSPTFKANLDTLADMLPLWVDALAERATDDDKQMQQAIDAATRLGLINSSELKEDRCPTCEGHGEIAVNFGIYSTGTPRIAVCPDCQGGDQ